MPKINLMKPVAVEAKSLNLHMKVRDEFRANLCDQHGETILEYEGYVPGFMPDDHFGDYLILNIDLDTGQITNWTPPTAARIEEWIAQQKVEG